MGAWGHRSFENDSALDWLAELGGIRDLRRTFTRVARAKPTAYIEVDDASAVIAAAEVVAAARGYAMKGAPGDIANWINRHSSKLTHGDAKLAKEAVARVLQNSELQALWADNGSKNPWRTEVKRLLARLAKPAKKRSARLSRGGAKRSVGPTPQQGIEIVTGAEARSPDGKLVASISGDPTHAMWTVTIEGRGGGGSVVALWCELDEVSLRWVGNDALEVRYPKRAKLEGERDDSWFLSGRSVSVRYKLY